MTLMGQVIYLKVSFPSAVFSDGLSMPVLFAYLGIMMSGACLTLMGLTGRAVSAETQAINCPGFRFCKVLWGYK